MPATSHAAHSHSVEAFHRATVAAGFVSGLVSGLSARGSDPAPVLAAAGVSRAVLADGAARVPIEHYAALYNALVAALRDEGFGLFSAPLRPGAFEFLCRATLSSADLGEALDRAARFLAIVLPDLEVVVRRRGAEAVIEIAQSPSAPWDGVDDPRRVFAFEWLLRLLHGLACWLAGRALTLDAVAFPFPRPAHATEYARVYTERSSFGAGRLAARFDAALLELPVRRDAGDLADFLVGAPGRIAMLYRRDREVARAVREWLAGRLADSPSLPDAARHLHLSPRTLHRRLREEGTSFRALKDALRRERALARLGRSRQGVAATAAELGYSEPSAFFRAFHHWTGEAPSAWRKRRRR